MNATSVRRRAPAPSPLPAATPTARRAYRCKCGRPVFFRNDVCLACGTPLGFDPELVLMRPLQATSDPAVFRTLRVRGDGNAPLLRYRRCTNATTAAACNWLVRDEGAATPRYCRCCRLDRTVPDPTDRNNAELWLKVETAKRQLVAQLIAMQLPVASRLNEDTARGVMFDLLRSPPEGPRVMTGHDDGLITLDIEEADDVHRETVRHQMHEPYRTLVGHLRHEIGHYYWQRLVDGTPLVDRCREIFGDDRADYGAALQAYYANGAPPDWRDRHVSEYATAHPYEDWAETWAHYLHLTDGLETARSFGLRASPDASGVEPFSPASLGLAGDPTMEDLAFLDLVNGWVELTVALNQVTRSMGEPDFYPFVLSIPAVRKLRFIHEVVRNAAGARMPGSPTGAGGTGPVEGSSMGTGGGASGGMAGGDGGVAGGSPGSEGTGTGSGMADSLPVTMPAPVDPLPPDTAPGVPTNAPADAPAAAPEAGPQDGMQDEVIA